MNFLFCFIPKVSNGFKPGKNNSQGAFLKPRFGLGLWLRLLALRTQWKETLAFNSILFWSSIYFARSGGSNIGGYLELEPKLRFEKCPMAQFYGYCLQQAKNQPLQNLGVVRLHRRLSQASRIFGVCVCMYFTVLHVGIHCVQSSIANSFPKFEPCLFSLSCVLTCFYFYFHTSQTQMSWRM